MVLIIIFGVVIGAIVSVVIIGVNDYRWHTRIQVTIPPPRRLKDWDVLGMHSEDNLLRDLSIEEALEVLPPRFEGCYQRIKDSGRYVLDYEPLLVSLIEIQFIKIFSEVIERTKIESVGADCNYAGSLIDSNGFKNGYGLENDRRIERFFIGIAAAYIRAVEEIVSGRTDYLIICANIISAVEALDVLVKEGDYNDLA